MHTIDLLLDRVSISNLQEPAPVGLVLDRILESALRAPDHGRLRPWRLVLIRGEARARLATVVADALLARDPEAPASVIDKQRGKFLRAPLIIALGAHVQDGHKVPVEEQMMSVAAAAMNLLNAVHAADFGAIWVTGANAYDATVLQALGFRPPHRLAGFLFVGTPLELPASARRPSLADHVREWTGPVTDR
jgi:nitroreductase